MTKIDAKKKQKKDALLNAAFELFTNESTADASISDIAKKAGVAKGTFYLYFKDKYDIRNRLVAKKASAIFTAAGQALQQENIPAFEDQLIFLVNDIIDRLSCDPKLVIFINKNLSWGIFKSAMEDATGELDENYFKLYDYLLRMASNSYSEANILIYMIVELISSTTYSSILANDPVCIDDLKPYLYRTIRLMVQSHEKSV